MILLPKGTPLKENLDPGKVNLPDAFRKLQKANFTGYLRFTAPQETGIVIFEAGRILSALFEKAGAPVTVAAQGLEAIFLRALEGGVRLDVYRLSADLAVAIHAFLHGQPLYKAQELKLIDIRALLVRLKDEKFTGGLRIYAEGQVSLIFYREGSPRGFFHDGADDIETSIDTSMSVARLPGAKIDVMSGREDEAAFLPDLMESANLEVLWRSAQVRVAQSRKLREEEALRRRQIEERERRIRALDLLKKTAERYLGKVGGSLVEKEFDRIAESVRTFSEAEMEGFYRGVGRSAKLVAGPSTVQTMLDEMKKGISTLE